jgi:hypothetical protein
MRVAYLDVSGGCPWSKMLPAPAEPVSPPDGVSPGTEVEGNGAVSLWPVRKFSMTPDGP